MIPYIRAILDVDQARDLAVDHPKLLADLYLQLKERYEYALELLGETAEIMGDSTGAAGFHLDGTTADWDEFDTFDDILELLKDD